jgi:carbon monoxide dehydrogenase subunit G
MQSVQHVAALALALALSFSVAAPRAVHAQTLSEASALSALPVAVSVVAPVAILAGGVVLTVVSVHASAAGTVIVLARASDGARATLQFSGRMLEGASLVAGAAVAVTVLSTGYLLSEAGRVLCLVPNELGKALLHHERITY